MLRLTVQVPGYHADKPVLRSSPTFLHFHRFILCRGKTCVCDVGCAAAWDFSDFRYMIVACFTLLRHRSTDSGGHFLVESVRAAASAPAQIGPWLSATAQNFPVSASSASSPTLKIAKHPSFQESASLFLLSHLAVSLTHSHPSPHQHLATDSTHASWIQSRAWRK